MHEGTLIADRYRINRQIGKGGTGKVYEATDTKFDVGVALKISTPPDLDYDEFLARFKREAKIGRLLGRQSSRFVRALDWGEFGGDSLYLAMDLVEDAEDLDLKHGEREERVERLANAAALVREVHQLKIVHRDVKPANFLTNNYGRIHLADFGLAKVMDDSLAELPQFGGHVTQSGFAMGTPYYMAPEQVDAKKVDQRADVYALGVMLFMALTGELPYTGNIGELLIAHQIVRNGDSPPPSPLQRDPSVPIQLSELCMKAIHLDPDQRLQSVDELLEGLKGFVKLSVRQPPATTPLSIKRVQLPTAIAKEHETEATTAPPLRSRTPRRRPLPPGLQRQENGRFACMRDGSELIRIPAGTFNPFGDVDDPEGTRPLVRLPSFFLARYPVTWAQFRRFCDETGHMLPEPAFDVEDDHPVHGVSWGDAWAYCAWAGLRLPTETEWEYAARGGDHERQYPWGDEPPAPELCNWHGNPLYGADGTSPIDAFPAGASLFGCEGLAGNVMEWTQEADDPMPGDGPMPDHEEQVLRGGAYRLDASYCEIRNRMQLRTVQREQDVGFRVALSLFPNQQGSDEETDFGERDEEPMPTRADRPTPAKKLKPRAHRTTRPLQQEDRDKTTRQLDVARRPKPPPKRPRPASATMKRQPPPPKRPKPPSATMRRPPPSDPMRRQKPSSGPGRRKRPAERRMRRPSSRIEAEPLFTDEPPTRRQTQEGGETQRPPAQTQRPPKRPRKTQRPVARAPEPVEDGPDPRVHFLRRSVMILERIADDVVRKTNEVKFVFGEAKIALSFVFDDERARWGYIEQRVTLERDRLQGEPSGYLNLLRAVNTVNLRVRGLRCMITSDRLRFRREVFLMQEQEAPLSAADVSEHCHSLLMAWALVFQPLREVQDGAPGEEALAELGVDEGSDPDAIAAVEGQLAGQGLQVEHVSGDRLGVGQGERQIVLAAVEGAVHVWMLMRAWSPPAEELRALRLRKRAPAVEELLMELNQKNRGSLLSMSWDPTRGIVARAVLGEANPSRQRLLAFLDALDVARARERFFSIGETDGNTPPQVF